jgi:hypothetical protein
MVYGISVVANFLEHAADRGRLRAILGERAMELNIGAGPMKDSGDEGVPRKCAAAKLNCRCDRDTELARRRRLPWPQ